MQANATSLSLTEYQQRPLSTVFGEQPGQHYRAIKLSAETITLEQLAPESKPGQIIELVLLQTATIGHLFSACQKCQLYLHGLNAINLRLGVLSYRFQVSCDDIGKARATLSTLAIKSGHEMALVENAPKLSEPGVLLMDMDSTTIEIECIDEIAALAGVGAEVAEVTELAMHGKLDFAESLTARVARLEGADEKILAEVADNLPLMPGLISLIKELKQHQWRIAIASGGFTYFADKLKQDLKLDEARANVLEVVDGKLTGNVIGRIVDAQVKADTLVDLTDTYQLPKKQTVAMGDGANDLVMMNAAQLGVAYKAKPVVLAQADTTICHSGLECMVHWLA